MKALDKSDEKAREEAIAKILAIGQPIRSLEELYGPPHDDDPEDLEDFLRYLEEQRSAGLRNAEMDPLE